MCMACAWLQRSSGVRSNESHGALVGVRNAGSMSRPGLVPNEAIIRWQFPWPS